MGAVRRAVSLLLMVTCLCAAAALAFTLPAGRLSFAATSPPDPLIETRTAIDRVIKILKDHQPSLTDKRRELRQMAEQYFDFADMSRSALGYHWRELSQDQRQQFVTLFSAFIEDAYLNRIQQYAGQDVEFTDQRSEAPGYASVNGRVATTGDAPVALSFRVNREGNDWKIYDVTVDSISITANYRNQFNRVINNQGYDRLMSDLRAKQNELAALMAK
jgi:phospholipid transport system substrate-binding protein